MCVCVCIAQLQNHRTIVLASASLWNVRVCNARCSRILFMKWNKINWRIQNPSNLLIFSGFCFRCFMLRMKLELDMKQWEHAYIASSGTIIYNNNDYQVAVAVCVLCAACAMCMLHWTVFEFIFFCFRSGWYKYNVYLSIYLWSTLALRLNKHHYFHVN